MTRSIFNFLWNSKCRPIHPLKIVDSIPGTCVPHRHGSGTIKTLLDLSVLSLNVTNREYGDGHRTSRLLQSIESTLSEEGASSSSAKHDILTRFGLAGGTGRSVFWKVSQRIKDTVASVSQSRNDVLLVVQFGVDYADINLNVWMCCRDGTHSFA